MLSAGPISHDSLQSGGVRHENFVPILFSRILARREVAVGRRGQEREAEQRAVIILHVWSHKIV